MVLRIINLRFLLKTSGSFISWKFHNHTFVKELIFNVTGMGVAGGGGVPGVQFHLVPGHQVIQYLLFIYILEELKEPNLNFTTRHNCQFKYI